MSAQDEDTKGRQTVSHTTNPRVTVLYGVATCTHCERKTRQLLEECAGGRRICRVCTECGRHIKVMDTTPHQAAHNREARTSTP